MRSPLFATAAVVAAVLLFAACENPFLAPNGPYTVRIQDAISPRMSAADAVRITRAYLLEQRGMIAAPELHIEPDVRDVWAVRARDARSLDGCLPARDSDAVVWITKGVGDYLNLHDYAWSVSVEQTDDPVKVACQGPGPAGVIVIDDETRQILGVFPLPGDAYPHPTPAIPTPAWSPAPG